MPAPKALTLRQPLQLTSHMPRFLPVYLTLLQSILLIILPACDKSRVIETAKGNATQYGLARCECDRLQRLNPPGDITLCFEQMQQAQRYLTFNFEMGKLSAAQKAEVLAHGDKVYSDCMQNKPAGH